jgi:conjugative relaxase-like TrwC/TraI family protein
MFTLKVQKDAKASVKYFEEHLSSNENTSGYYINGKDVSVGVWGGYAGRSIGLLPGSQVTKSDFMALLANSSPDGSKKLTPRQKDNRRLFFDGTISAPKSVSIMALVADDERLLIAHREASLEALKLVETLAQTRVRVSGKNELRKTGNLLAAQFAHTTSRSNDPHLHTHNVIMNFTWDGVEKRFKALEASQLYNQATFVTEVYRNALAKRVLDLGYEIESDVYGFKIKGVSNELCDLYSKRSVAIKGEIRKKELEEGRLLSNNEKSHIAHKSRKKKNKDLTYSQVKEHFHSQISFNQLADLHNLVDDAKKKSHHLSSIKEDEKTLDPVLIEKRDALVENIAINKGLMHLFERTSVATYSDVLKASLRSNLGRLDLEKLEKVLSSRTDLIVKENLVVSKEELAREWFCVDYVNTKAGQSKPVIENIDRSFIDSLKDQGLREDQRLSLCGLLSNKDGVVSLRGSAGAGKSHTISLLINELKKQKIEVLPLAPTSGAAENLRSDFQVDTMTLQGFLKSNLGGKNPKYLIVDEAGLCSLKQMKDLFVKAEDLGARVLLVGDTKQNLSVESGDSLRILEKFSEMKTFQLTKIERQKDPDYRYAIQSLVDFKVEEAFGTFADMGVFKEHEDSKNEGNPIFHEAAKEYVDDLALKKKSLVVGFSWTDVDGLNKEIRSRLLSEKVLSADGVVSRDVFEDLSLTASERLSTNSYFSHSKDLFVILRKDLKGFKRNTPYKIDSVSDGSFFLSAEDKSLIEFSVGFNEKSTISPVDFNLLVQKSIVVSPGEKLLLQSNYKSNDKSSRGKKKNNFLNGEIVSVESTLNEEIRLSDGRTLPKDYNLFTYGYAVTSVASQGKTADKVIVAASNASGRAVSYNSFYVAASRGKNEISIHVNDLDRIKATLNSIATRESAMEFIHKTIKDLDPEEQKKWLDVKNESGRVFGQNIHEDFLMEQIRVKKEIDLKISGGPSVQNIENSSPSSKDPERPSVDLLTSFIDRQKEKVREESKRQLREKRNLLYEENMEFSQNYNRKSKTKTPDLYMGPDD